ncbi:siderophore-interacting protein [Microbacterium marinilacus]|uniref:Siderophore-interacting protein n=1 Tax=Microbacterium marinilacus TaxID=415209 RepID=A0ABP7BQS0_9MICO|nr:siderophore-interacting protein [Microbacterium marinilacus]MBY0689872.1 siderophore-interacting protein [Microbacterium marinilacus]
MTGAGGHATGPRPWEYSAFRVSVSATQRLSPGFIRVTLAGEDLRHFATWGLDQRIKLVLPMPDGSRPDFGLLDEPTPHPRDWYARWKALPIGERNVLRTYTPAGIRPDRGEIDVDLFIHEPAGPASAWALSCRVGDELVVTGPDSRVGRTGYGIHYTPPEPPSAVLLVGDESALPAIANILTGLAPGTPADVLLELADPADDTLSGRVAPVRPQIVARTGAAGDALERAVHGWGERDGDTAATDPGLYAWIAGEAAATIRIRRHLTATLGIPKERVAFLGYWKLGGPLVE